MKISDKEAKLIASGKLNAVIRWEAPLEKVCDILFDVEGVVYKLKDKKKWSLHRCVSKKTSTAFGCDSLTNAKATITFLYGEYSRIKDDVVYLVMIEKEKQQRTLAV